MCHTNSVPVDSCQRCRHVISAGLHTQAAAERYYNGGADEITFLNITAFRKPVLADQPMLQLLKECSKNIFVPLCVGGGIKDYEDPNGTKYTALDVAAAYFKAGADKVAISSAVSVTLIHCAANLCSRLISVLCFVCSVGRGGRAAIHCRRKKENWTKLHRTDCQRVWEPSCRDISRSEARVC